MNTNDKIFKANPIAKKASKFSNITGTTPADFGIDTSRLERLKAELKTLETVTLIDAERRLALHEGYLADNIRLANAGQMDPRNVDAERVYIKNIQDEISNIKNVLIAEKRIEVDREQRSINALFEKQIDALKERAKTDPNALAALKELEAQRASFSGSKTKIIVITIVGIVLLVVGTIIFIKIRKKSKATV